MKKKKEIENHTNEQATVIAELRKENFQLKQEIVLLKDDIRLWEENGILLSQEEQQYFFAQHHKLKQIEEEQKRTEKLQIEKSAERLNLLRGC